MGRQEKLWSGNQWPFDRRLGSGGDDPSADQSRSSKFPLGRRAAGIGREATTGPARTSGPPVFPDGPTGSWQPLWLVRDAPTDPRVTSAIPTPWRASWAV
jgi:hypothetical protein